MQRVLTESDFPGYTEAVARENISRAAACLGVPETICGVDVKSLTGRHIRLLCIAGSPFLLRDVTANELCNNPIIDVHVMTFLWILSPKFCASQRKRNRFFKSIRHVAKMKVNDVVKQIMDYVTEAYFDESKGDEKKSFYSFEIGIVQNLHRSWGLPVDMWENHWLRNMIRRFSGKPNPLDVPIKILFQLQKAERRAADPACILSNYSEEFLRKGLQRINDLHQYEHDLLKEKVKWDDSIQVPRFEI